MPTCSDSDYRINTVALHNHIIGLGIMNGSTKYNKLWFRYANKFRKGN